MEQYKPQDSEVYYLCVEIEINLRNHLCFD